MTKLKNHAISGAHVNPERSARLAELVKKEIARQDAVKPEETIFSAPKKRDRREKKLRTSIHTLGLGARISWILREEHIEQLGHLIQHTQKELLEMKGLGKTSVGVIEIALEFIGLRLGMRLRKPWPKKSHTGKLTHH